MNQELTGILDSALRFSLWTFLGALFIFLLISRASPAISSFLVRGKGEEQIVLGRLLGGQMSGDKQQAGQAGLHPGYGALR